MSMTIEEAIKVLRQHNVKGASVLRITKGQALEKDLLVQVLDSCEQLISEKSEYKRLLKAAVEDFSFVSEKFINSMDSSCSMFNHIAGCVKGCPMSSSDDYGRCKWRYADEALALIGDNVNGI